MPLAKIGKALGASTEGIRKALINAKAAKPRVIVKRILPDELKRLSLGDGGINDTLSR